VLCYNFVVSAATLLMLQLNCYYHVRIV